MNLNRTHPAAAGRRVSSARNRAGGAALRAPEQVGVRRARVGDAALAAVQFIDGRGESSLRNEVAGKTRRAGAVAAAAAGDDAEQRVTVVERR